MAVSRNRLFAGFGNNVVDNVNSVTLDSASIANIDITDNSIMGTVGTGSTLDIGINGIPGIMLVNPGGGPDYVGLTRNGGLKLYTIPTGVKISNSGDEFFAQGGELIADSATLTNLTLNGELVDSAWVAARSTGGGASVTVSSTAPSSPSAGDLWYDDENGFLLLYYEDADTNQWVQAAGGGQNPLVQEGDSSWSLAADLTISGDLTVTGDAAAANFNSTSDARLKDNIETINNAIDKVSQLRGVSYDKDGRRQIGVIAQETELVIPEVVTTNDDGFKTVAYGNIVGLLIEAVKDLQMQVDTLKGQINGGD